MADQNPQINQNVDNQNDTDELFGGSDDIFENSDLLQPINSEVDTAHQVIKSQNDLNNFSGEVQNNNAENQVSEYSDSKIYIQNDTQDEEINQLKNPNDVQGTSDDLFDNTKQENVETNTEFTNLYNDNGNIEQQSQENSYSDNDDIFNETPVNSDETFEEIPEIEDISGNTEQENSVMSNEPSVPTSSDSDETFEEIPEIEDISGNTEEESPVMSNEPSVPSSVESDETFEEIPEIEDISGDNQEENFEPSSIETGSQYSQETENVDDEESTDNVQSTSTENPDNNYDDINDDIAELQNRENEEVDNTDGSEYLNTDEENSKEEYQETDNFDNDEISNYGHQDAVENIPENTDISDDGLDEDKDEKYDDEETEEEFVPNGENNDGDEEFVPQDEQEENIEQETKEDDIESAVVQDYEKYDPNLFKTDVQKKFGELQWKTEKIHELVGKDLDVGFDLLGGNDDRQKIMYKISSGSDYVTIEKNEFNKEDESNEENTLEFVLLEDLEQNMSVSVIVNEVELYDEIKDLQKDTNKKMQVMEKMNKFIFLLDEEYKKIQKYQKEKEERNAVKGVFRNF